MGDPLQERAPDETPEQVSSINQLAAFCLWPRGLCSLVLSCALWSARRSCHPFVVFLVAGLVNVISYIYPGVLGVSARSIRLAR